MQRRILAAAVFMLVASISVLAKGTILYVYGVSATGITSTSATIIWGTLLSTTSQVAYGTTTNYGSLTVLDTNLVLAHSQTLSGLTPNTTYHYQVMSKTSSGSLYVAGDFTFTTLPNVVQGMISGVSVSAITGSSATITWTSNTPASSMVQYGPTTNYGISTATDANLVISHSVTLVALNPNTLYHFRVWSVDASGNYGISGDNIFTTLPGSLQTTLSGVSASFVTSTSATIIWTTSGEASSQVNYGTTTSYGSSTAFDPTMVTSHVVTLSQLSANTVYHYQVLSTDDSGNLLVSPDFTFTTPALSLFLPQINFLPDELTGIAVANLGQSPATLNFTAFDSTGKQVQGNNLTNPASETLNAGTQLPVVVDQIFGLGISSVWPAGWAEVNSSSASIKGFFLTFDGAFSMMDGALLATSLPSSIVLPETGGLDYAKLSLSNPSSSVASVTVDLVGSDGTLRGEFQTSIPGFGTYNADLYAQIFTGVTVALSDYIQISSSTPLLAYEYFGNISKDFSVLAGQDQTAGGSTTLYAPLYVIGGPWNSSISIVNLDATPATVTLAWIGNDGSQIGSQVVPIAANGKIYISDRSFFTGTVPTQTVEGYVRITSSGARLSGSILYSDVIHGAFSSAVPLDTALQQSGVLSHVASDATYFTGLVIANPNGADATVQIQLYTSAGQLDQSVTQVIPAGQRISRLLTEYFPALAGQNRTSGYVKVTADQGLATLGAFGDNTLSFISALPLQSVP